jgi:hypothetical protein
MVEAQHVRQGRKARRVIRFRSEGCSGATRVTYPTSGSCRKCFQRDGAGLGRAKRAGRIHDPANHHEVSHQRRELDRAGLAKKADRIFIHPVADTVSLHQLGNEIGSCLLVRGQSARPPASASTAPCATPDSSAFCSVRLPLELVAGFAGNHADCQFAGPLGQAPPETQRFAGRADPLHEHRRKQQWNERADGPVTPAARLKGANNRRIASLDFFFLISPNGSSATIGQAMVPPCVPIQGGTP